ncbi:MAG: bifunctional 4-hydroxy-2-oxoglutarate aldolase/2-dehydro-3-deoxy-phosphogluconate aldolase [Acidobacteria bacterium]|nr:bifunctional 4-hydroxy-2-oxoglutarate aldolase/2-dehydro-3-deoxy-phosphogluconate aldolase [Acidobacteriota bacterium]MBW4044540.1 bifunctional 4-hydroxy-2-oxoglutarate aldolase/2-dehydro-3-deoxy-phosphogluconate aldolase [Acidobacteriota bacterium]
MPSTLEKILSRCLVPVLRARSADLAYQAIDLLLECGITVVEITMTVPDASQVIAGACRRFGDAVLIGSGTITTAEQCESTIEAGAEFVVSPGLFPEVVARTKALGKLSLPGALTPTEVMQAWTLGADVVKVFPCSAMGGASYLAALRAPFPQIRLMPTGGVTVQTAGAYLQAGAVALGVGSDLISDARLASGQFESIRAAAASYREVVRIHRQEAALQQ